MSKIIACVLALCAMTWTTSCISIASINEDFRKVDALWTAENAEYTAERFPHRLDAPIEDAYEALRATFADLGLAVASQDRGEREAVLVTKNEAPHPLSQDQWEEVREIENPRTKEISWVLSIPSDPSGYLVTTKVVLVADGDQTLLSVDYYLEMPEYEDMGIIPSRQAPPSAVRMFSSMLLERTEANLSSRTPEG